MAKSASDRKRHGQHYTPTNLARFLARRTLASLDVDGTITVLDPACGDGELLIAIHFEAMRINPGVNLVLHGYDVDPDAIEVAQKRAAEAGVIISIEHDDFLLASDAMAAGTYDAIITNPPYVRTQQLGQKTAQLLALKYGLSGRIDLTHPFVTIAPRVLRKGGVLGLLSSNRFLTTRAGVNMRGTLATEMTPVEIYDLGDTKLFEAAVLPAITIAVNTQRTSEDCVFVSAYESKGESDGSASLFDSLDEQADAVATYEGRAITIRAGVLVQGSTPDAPWRMAHEDGETWLNDIAESTWKTFGEVAKIRVGIKTTADTVFISDSWDSTKPSPESDLLLPLVTHHNLTPWNVSSTDSTKVLYPYELNAAQRRLVDMTRFPRAMAYLETHAERLKGRKYVVDGGREWFEIWVPQRPSLWAKGKIVFPDISELPRFAYDLSGSVVNGDCYWISVDDIGDEELAYLMVGVGNSSLATRFYDAVCGNKLYSGRRRWITQYVSKFPLPDPSTDEATRLIAHVKYLISIGSSGVGDEDAARLDELVEAAFAATRGAAPQPQAPLF